jgi:hypothetical protein
VGVAWSLLSRRTAHKLCGRQAEVISAPASPHRVRCTSNEELGIRTQSSGWILVEINGKKAQTHHETSFQVYGMPKCVETVVHFGQLRCEQGQRMYPGGTLYGRLGFGTLSTRPISSYRYLTHTDASLKEGSGDMDRGHEVAECE